jgi:hypothetical protein
VSRPRQPLVAWSQAARCEGDGAQPRCPGSAQGGERERRAGREQIGGGDEVASRDRAEVKTVQDGLPRITELATGHCGRVVKPIGEELQPATTHTRRAHREKVHGHSQEHGVAREQAAHELASHVGESHLAMACSSSNRVKSIAKRGHEGVGVSNDEHGISPTQCKGSGYASARRNRHEVHRVSGHDRKYKTGDAMRVACYATLRDSLV